MTLIIDNTPVLKYDPADLEVPQNAQVLQSNGSINYILSFLHSSKTIYWACPKLKFHYDVCHQLQACFIEQADDSNLG